MKVDQRMDEEKRYAYWLCCLTGIGDRSIERLLSVCGGSAKNVYFASRQTWKDILSEKQYQTITAVTDVWDLEREYAKLTDRKISMVVRGEKNYPNRLKRISDSPYSIFYMGKLPEEEKLSVAIIGARDCSPYGSFVAQQLGGFLGERGVQIISGMARGIDGISQKAALDAGGSSFGVMGNGVDVCYPVQNKKLYEQLKIQGGVLSTYRPGTLAKPQNFPPRNRIVSGLADVVVVVEARVKSGTLITVDMALEQGKEVYVVPGRITDRLSDGCNRLVGQGAGVILSPEIFWEELEESYSNKLLDLKSFTERNEKSLNIKIELDVALKKLYECLDFYPQSVDEILRKMGKEYSGSQINTMLLRLCLLNCAVQTGTGHFSRKI